ncbi:MAG TPA: PAS domain-containing sensor histidine kinase [Kofleriaceae bacterium]|jgi:PAS domain S-box-containing protein
MAQLLTGTEYRLLVENSPVMVWRSGLDAKCDYFNDTWLAFTGRPIDQELGDGWAEGVHAEDLARCVEYYLDHFRRREAFEMEYRLRRHDGAYRWIFDRGVPYTIDGTFAGFIGSCVDVDDRRRAQDAREQRDQEQLALAREFEQWILAIVSHDIRNPLNAIDGAAQLLALRAGQDDKLRAIADRIARSSARITNIVGDLLDLSRERHGAGIPIVTDLTDLNVLCKEVADEIATFAKDHAITIERAGNATGLWDAHRLVQALSNLVGNAVKHGTPGRPVAIRVRADDAQAVVEIHNHGAIPLDVMPRLFQPFASRRDTTAHREGLGLGLFIARSIARAHRGDLQVESSPERGTTFRLVLPRGAP